MQNNQTDREKERYVDTEIDHEIENLMWDDQLAEWDFDDLIGDDSDDDDGNYYEDFSSSYHDDIKVVHIDDLIGDDSDNDSGDSNNY